MRKKRNRSMSVGTWLVNNFLWVFILKLSSYYFPITVLWNFFLFIRLKFYMSFILFYFRFYINLIGKGTLNKFTCFILEHHVICLKTIPCMTHKAATWTPTDCQQWMIGNRCLLGTQKIPWHVCRFQLYWYCFVIYS